VIKKVSRHLLGFLFLLFVVSFLDRINIGFAGLTMMKDLGLTSTQFGFATTLFYPGLHRVRGSEQHRPGTDRRPPVDRHDHDRLGAGVDRHDVRNQRAVALLLAGARGHHRGRFPSRHAAVPDVLVSGRVPGSRQRAVHDRDAGDGRVRSALSGPILGLDGTYGLKGWHGLFLLEGLPAAVLGWSCTSTSPTRRSWPRLAVRRQKDTLLANADR
jgi:ACS family 4-hydroxyphenylacetate permease-like MFS transporter